jgi:hypothetical protein
VRAPVPFDRYAAARRGAAALAAASAVAVGAALIATSGGGGGPRTKAARARLAAPPVRAPYPDTPAGAVGAATAWGQTAAFAAINGTWATAVRPLATAAFWPRLAPGQRASALVHSRIASLHTGFAVRRWPLGDAVQSYAPRAARVRVWELVALGIPGPLAAVAYDTRTIELQWAAGGWKVADVAPGPDLTPPATNTSTARAESWVAAVDQLKSYTYAP